VLLRILLPWTPESRFSVYGLAPKPFELLRGELSSPATKAEPAPRTGVFAETGIRGGTDGPAGAGLGPTIAVVWFIGAAAGGFVASGTGGLDHPGFRGRRAVTDETVLGVLEDCREELDIHAYLAVIETPHIRAPALFGWIRPRLLLPRGVLCALSPGELRHVFLHELSHLKRHDIAFNWLAALAQALHWFNPAVWLAAQQARIDMELSCDELTLSHLDVQEHREYGRTIIKLLDTSVQTRRLAMLAAIGEDATQVKRRIQMIANFQQSHRGSPALAVGILLALGVFFLADARVDTAPRKQAEASGSSERKAVPFSRQRRAEEARRKGAFRGRGDPGCRWNDGPWWTRAIAGGHGRQPIPTPDRFYLARRT